MARKPQTADVVLPRYLRDGRLTSMPRPGDKRRMVLEHIVQLFEPGEAFAETEVNARLRPLWRDVAALRRYLVDEGLLGRENGWYWRTGGPVDV